MENTKKTLEVFTQKHGMNLESNYGFIPMHNQIIVNVFGMIQVEFTEEQESYEAENFEEVPTMKVQPATRDDYSKSEFHSNPVNKWSLIEIFNEDLIKIAKDFSLDEERLKSLVFDCMTLFKDKEGKGLFLFFFNHLLFRKAIIEKNIDHIIRRLVNLFRSFCNAYPENTDNNFKKFFLPRFAKSNKIC